MTDLIHCEACKDAFPPFYPPGWVVQTETGRIHRGCVPINFGVCASCELTALPIEIMIEGLICPDCWDGQENGPTPSTCSECNGTMEVHSPGCTFVNVNNLPRGPHE